MLGVNQLQSMIEPTVVDMGFEFWGLEYQSGSSLLRIYIDASNGITVDDCAKVSRQLSVILDVEDPIKSEYRLEVSSPGLSRPFYSIEQYQDFIGHILRIKLRASFDGRKQFKGLLNKVDIATNEIAVVENDDEWVIPFEMVEKANLIPQFD